MGRLCCCFGSRSGDKGSKVEDAKVEGKPVVAAGDGGKKIGKGGGQSAVLVEFFTSQGCSSCPPADLIMSRLAQEGAAGSVPVLVLAYHVDIWDHLGWRDPFGSSAWSQRQRTYVEALQQDSICTPQAVVQGAAHCVGGMEALTRLISSAKRFPTPDLSLTFSRPSSSGAEDSSQSSLRVSGTLTSRPKIDEHRVDVMLALYEDNLVTMCNKGENTGRTLTNDSVVRALVRLHTLENAAAKKSKHFEADVPVWETFNRSRAGAVVFLQNQLTKEVYGAQKFELPEDL
eukprot:TRINITY_DN13288_c0_g1_i1.p2 TRINITY_DN13288_c0_g1~~TRINITY_DN13288_c0_g1_i1.p2  ORF type:complete len:287 (-),score=51.40 TRINITY_DN13288_c0_g1_i1:1778-2638(-)